jgi:hypothetical protein
LELLREANQSVQRGHQRATATDLVPTTEPKEDFLGRPKPFDIIDDASFNFVSNFNCFHSEILFEHLARVLADVSIVERAQRQAASGPSSSSQLTESVKPPYHDAPAPMSILNLWRGLMIAVSSGEKAPGGFTESGSGKRPSGGGSDELGVGGLIESIKNR